MVWSTGRRLAGVIVVVTVLAATAIAARQRPGVADATIETAIETAWLPAPDGGVMLADAAHPRAIASVGRDTIGSLTSVVQAGRSAVLLAERMAAVVDDRTWSVNPSRVQTSRNTFAVAGAGAAWLIAPGAGRAAGSPAGRVTGPEGRVLCWGDNADGKLGRGFVSNDNAPPLALAPVRNAEGTGDMLGAVDVASGPLATCALVAGGSVLCWGDLFRTDLPTPIPTPTGVTGASDLGTGHHACAVTDGDVTCWGWTGDFSPSMSPTVVPGAGPAVSVHTDYFTSCAVRRDGSLRCWGAVPTGNGFEPGPEPRRIEPR